MCVSVFAYVGVEGLVFGMDLQVVDWGQQSSNAAYRGIVFVLYLRRRMKLEEENAYLHAHGHAHIKSRPRTVTPRCQTSGY